MLQLPQIDLNGLLPIAGLAAIAVAIIAALLLRSLLHSRLALLIAIVAGVVLAGPALAGSIASIIWALVPLAIVLAGGMVMVLWLLHRNPELLSIARDIVPRRAPDTPPLALPAAPRTDTVVINQPAAVQQPASRSKTLVSTDGERWGF